MTSKDLLSSVTIDSKDQPESKDDRERWQESESRNFVLSIRLKVDDDDDDDHIWCHDELWS